jgi:hypothetical protein
MRNYELRLQLIIAKAQLLLKEPGRPWHSDIKAALAEIASEAKKAYDEVANDRGWEAGDR